MIDRKKCSLCSVLAMLLLMHLAAGSSALAQGRRMGLNAQSSQQRDPLAFLKRALANAGAAALASDQEASFNTLIASFLNANKPGQPDAAEKAARDAYSNAIFSKNSTAATSAADSLSALLAARQRTQLEAEAGFQIQALNILHGDQASALQNKMGVNGVLRVLQTLVGPGLRGGRPGAAGFGAQMRLR